MWTDNARKIAKIKHQEKYEALMKERMQKYDENPNRCKKCNKILAYDKKRNKFCSSSCSASVGNLGQQRNVSSRVYAQKPCLFCGKTTNGLKFCSKECWSNHCKQNRKKRIESAGCLIHYRKEKWYLEETRGNKCEICQNTEWLGNPIPLDIHHVNGDSDDNRFENVQLICPNCHRQTDTYGGKNKNGRHSRRKGYRNKRYEQGLSH